MTVSSQRAAAGWWARLRRFMADDRGNTLVSFGVAFPLVAGAVGIGIDYSAAARVRGKMQTVADASALNAAREFQMVQANVDKVSAVARNYAGQIEGAPVAADELFFEPEVVARGSTANAPAA